MMSTVSRESIAKGFIPGNGKIAVKSYMRIFNSVAGSYSKH